MKLVRTVMAVAALSATIGFVHAATIVDTGDPPTSGPLFFSNDSFAGEFTLNAETTIESIEHHIRVDGSGLVEFRIYNDGGNVPGSIFPGSVQSVFLPSSPKGWYGVSGLNLTLPAGTYWVAFDPGTTPGFSWQGAPAGLGNEARTIGTSGWFDVDSWNLGWRIEGTVVPVPAALPLLATALGLLGFGARRKLAA